MAEDPNPLSIGTNDQDPALDVLYSSYDDLSQCLKACFLYMGIFPRRQEISTSKLIRLWEAERLVKTQSYTRHVFHEAALKILKSLASQSVIFVTTSSLSDGIQACRLHSVFRHLSVNEARKEYLFQIVNKFPRNGFQEVLNGHRRICLQNSTLFGTIKEANNLMSSVSNVRSLLCTGPHHSFPVPMQFKMRLLRVLDAVSIRFYIFPSEIVQLVQLRYFAFTYNGMLHASIAQLWNLEFLIVERHLSIVSHHAPLYIPVEIWNMKELRHLQVTGALLPHPPNGAILPNLLSISKINARCFTTAVFNSIPKLQKPSIQIGTLGHNPFSFSNHLSRVKTLHSLKCIVVNPKPKSQATCPPAPTKIFPSGLVKLTLSGFGYPWKYLGEFGDDHLKTLKVLKLRNYAFQGPEWETIIGNSWPEVLHLEDLDLVYWRVTRSTFSYFSHLSIRHCYRLQEIPTKLGFQKFFKLIEVVDVQPSVVASAKKIVQQRNNDGGELQLNINCSYWD